MLKISLFCLLIASVLCAFTYKKYSIDDPDALCLDGTKPAYYFKEGKKLNWVIYFEGGGWCGTPESLGATIEDCYQRSKTRLGSSNSYTDTYQYKDGLLGDNP